MKPAWPSVFTCFLLYLLPLPGLAQPSYTNPILAGFYPDPSICRVGADYYLVNSTFAYFPGIPVFHSRDLAHWQLIGHVLDRPAQLPLQGLRVSEGLFAPAIRYHRGLFYVTCTLVGGKGNFVATAKDPAGPWSDPQWLPAVNGIDPSPFFDTDGQAYLVYNSIPPDNRPLYNGHRTIRLIRFDPERRTTVGQNRVLVNGGTDLSSQPSWIEGPHLFRQAGYYYLIAAEGGTGVNHSEVVFRSPALDSPFVPYSKNPVLTQRTADPGRAYPVSATGHADLVQLPDSSWQAVFLGTRPYQGDDYNTGRETFLAPVRWIDGWPVINPDFATIRYTYPLPLPYRQQPVPYSGNFTITDPFSQPVLSPDWIFLRTPSESGYRLKEKKGFLSLQVRPQTAAGFSNPSFLARRQQHLQFTATTALQFQPGGSHEKAGLLVFQNETHFYYLCRSVDEQHQPVVQLYRSASNQADSNRMDLLASRKTVVSGKNLVLKVTGNKDRYVFHYRSGSRPWQLLAEADGTFLSTRVAGGFVGTTIGPYATSLGQPSQATAYYDWFTYAGKDEVYYRKQELIR